MNTDCLDTAKVVLFLTADDSDYHRLTL